MWGSNLVPLIESLKPNEVVELGGVKFYIPWGRLTVGASFFLRTLVPAKDVLETLKQHAGPYGPGLRAHPRHEFGFYGVRVWYLGRSLPT